MKKIALFVFLSLFGIISSSFASSSMQNPIDFGKVLANVGRIFISSDDSIWDDADGFSKTNKILSFEVANDKKGKIGTIEWKITTETEFYKQYLATKKIVYEQFITVIKGNPELNEKNGRPIFRPGDEFKMRIHFLSKSEKPVIFPFALIVSGYEISLPDRIILSNGTKLKVNSGHSFNLAEKPITLEPLSDVDATILVKVT